MKKNILAAIPVLAGLAALMGFTPQAEAGRHYPAPAQCYESFNLGGLRYTYPVECPRNVQVIQPRGPVTYYQTRGGGVTIIQPAYKSAPAYYHGRRDDRRHHHRDHGRHNGRGHNPHHRH